jgi:hypothetical protein
VLDLTLVCAFATGKESLMARFETRVTRRCEAAVITAYRELREIGTADPQAFNACTTLYRIHHPEASVTEARRLVAEWIDHHIIRQENTMALAGCGCGEDHA